MMEKIKDRYIVLAITAVSILLLIIWTAGAPEAFLSDDNRTQWYPIIERSYEQFFETGKMPDCNFYLAKGLHITEPGYYGTTNPLMLLSYSIAHFTPINTNTIAVYICICITLGNIFMYLLCRSFKLNKACSLLAVGMLSSCSAFLAFCYWYYVFNNYLFIPLILYVLLKTYDNKAGYFTVGIILSIELYCGNIQYTFFSYIVYCIIALAIIAFCQRKYIKKAICNIAVGLCLSAPIFLLCTNAASSFNTDGRNTFLAFPYYLVTQFFNSLYPSALFETLGIDFFGSLLVPGFMNRTDKYICYCGAPFAAILIWLVFVIKDYKKKISSEEKKSFTHRIVDMVKYVLKRIKNPDGQDHIKAVTIGIGITIIYFVTYMAGAFTSVILSVIPVVNKFRYLFKAFFVVIPLISVAGSIAVSKMNGKRRKAVLVISSVLVGIGIVNNFFAYKCTNEMFASDDNKTYSEEKDYAENMIAQNNMDLKNYRAVCILDKGGVEEITFEQSKSLIRNFPAYIRTFSLSAYEMSLSEDVKEQFDQLYDPENVTTIYANAGQVDDFYENNSDPYSVKRLEQQLISNSVKYIFIENAFSENGRRYLAMGKTNYEIVEDVIAQMDNISIEKVINVNKNFDVLVLNGADRICTAQDGENVTLYDEHMDQLSFEANKAQDYILSFTYNKNITARLIDESGSAYELMTSETPDGNILVNNTVGSGRIYISYNDIICTAASVLEAVNVILVLGLTCYFVFIYIKKCKRNEV